MKYSKSTFPLNTAEGDFVTTADGDGELPGTGITEGIDDGPVVVGCEAIIGFWEVGATVTGDRDGPIEGVTVGGPACEAGSLLG